jgi:trans-aconitate methyltransferase
VWQDDRLVRHFVEEVRGGVPYAADQIEVMLRVIAARAEPVRRFADLGCGAGVLARALLTRYPMARATLVDFSEPMLDAARGVLGAHVPAPRFVLADLASPQWTVALDADATFDAIVSAYAIHHLSHERKRALYTEIHDRLRSGGVFVNVEHVASATLAIEAMSDGLIVDCLHVFQRARGSTKSRAQLADEFAHRPDKAANILAPVEAQCEWLRDIGFVDVDCYFKVFELAVFGGRKP